MPNIKYTDKVLKKNYDQNVRSIVTEGLITNPNIQSRGYISKFLWDTGATCSAINSKIVEDLKLKSNSVEKVITANGVIDCNFYYVHILLSTGSNYITATNVFVTSLELEDSVHAIIGMDIISRGSFLLVNDINTNKTMFEYSMQKVNYTNR